MLGGRFAVHHGGKGANAAVAAARAGARVTMIAAVGADEHGDHGVAALEAEGVDVSRIRRVDGEPTGVALIVVGPRGENQIALAPGANATLELDADDRALIGEADVVLTNHEIPASTVLDALHAARDGSTLAILNPAPAHALPSDVLSLGPILTPNEHELVVAIGNDDTGPALDELAVRHHGPIIVTQGPAGALLADRDRRQRFAGHPAASVVDTTGRRRHVRRRPRRMAGVRRRAARRDHRRQRRRFALGRCGRCESRNAEPRGDRRTARPELTVRRQAVDGAPVR